MLGALTLKVYVGLGRTSLEANDHMPRGFRLLAKLHNWHWRNVFGDGPQWSILVQIKIGSSQNIYVPLRHVGIGKQKEHVSILKMTRKHVK